MPKLEAIQPYVEQVFDDSDVKAQLSRMSANLRSAQSRASNARTKKKALKDPKLRSRLIAGGRAAVAAGVAIKQGPDKRKRRSRRGRLLVLLGLSAAGLLAANADARDRLLKLVGVGNDEPSGDTSTP